MTDESSVMSDYSTFIKKIFGKEKLAEKQLEDIQVDKGVSLSEVLSRLESLCRSTSPVEPPDIYNEISLQSHYIQSCLKLLHKETIEKISNRIYEDASKWLTTLFRLDNMYLHSHDKRVDGLLKVCRLALHAKYQKYGSDGFTALYTRPPVVYISSAAPPELGKTLRNELGLPQSSICTVQCNTVNGSPYTMDVSVFERLLTDDISCGKTPLLLIGYAGTPLSGHTDNLSRLREICTQSGVWFHVEGDTLANLALNNNQPSIHVATNADSLTMNIPHWFGIPNLPYCTFYRTNNRAMAVSSGLVNTAEDQLNILPLWNIIQFMGTHDLYKMIEHASEMAQQMSLRLDMMTSIRRIEQPSGISPVIIFKYKASPTLPLSINSTDVNKEKAIASTRGIVDVSPKLKDSFNKLLSVYLQANVPKVSIEDVVIPREGLCMRFNPLHSSRKFETSKLDIDDFVEKLKEKTVELSNTLINRNSFQDVFQRVPDVILIDATDEPILGAFQCIPKYWKTKNMSNLSDMKKHEANELNTKIYLALSNVYDFVHKAVLSNGQVYIQVGVVRPEFDLPQFAEVVTKYTVEMEDNAKFVESVSGTVQKSIEEARQRLEREREEKFFHDDVLRNVPLVSSFYNWFSPPPKENHGVIGKSLDLSSGKLESTDKIYKMKMQIHTDDSDAASHISTISKQSEPPVGESTIDVILETSTKNVNDGESDGSLSDDELETDSDNDEKTELIVSAEEAKPTEPLNPSDSDVKVTPDDNVKESNV